MFGLIRLSPPNGPESLDEKIEELKKKKVEYTEDGEKLLKEENSEMEKQIEQEVDDELERERRAEEGYGDEDDYYEENDGFKDEPASKNDSRGKYQRDNERKPVAE